MPVLRAPGGERGVGVVQLPSPVTGAGRVPVSPPRPREGAAGLRRPPRGRKAPGRPAGEGARRPGTLLKGRTGGNPPLPTPLSPAGKARPAPAAWGSCSRPAPPLTGETLEPARPAAEPRRGLPSAARKRLGATPPTLSGEGRQLRGGLREMEAAPGASTCPGWGRAAGRAARHREEGAEGKGTHAVSAI